MESNQRVLPLWAREILFYPQKDGFFIRGKDAADSVTGWRLPALFIPEEALGKQNIGLFVDPKDIAEEWGKVVVYPETLAILHSFIQTSG